MRKSMFFGLFLAGLALFSACEKETLDTNELSSSKGGGQNGGGHQRPTPIDISTLPASITDYVTANYAGSTIEKAGTLPNGNYMVMIQADGSQPVVLVFDASGNFVEVAPLPPHGGDRPHPTPIDISTLPASITDYVTANYAGSTIEKAGTLPNGNYMVMIQADGSQPVVLVFDASGNFVEVAPLPQGGGHGGDRPHPTPIDISTLPASITDYVTANYAGSTIEKAGTLPNGNYMVMIQADGSQPVVLVFDASGNFVEVAPLPPHGGGHGGDRPRPTPIDISTLPASITDYVTANYAGSTIEKAGTLPNGNYMVMVQADGSQPVVLVFDASGNFVEVAPLPPHGGGHGHGG
jgi:predicted proteasome-type protease